MPLIELGGFQDIRSKEVSIAIRAKKRIFEDAPFKRSKDDLIVDATNTLTSFGNSTVRKAIVLQNGESLEEVLPFGFIAEFKIDSNRNPSFHKAYMHIPPGSSFNIKA